MAGGANPNRQAAEGNLRNIRQMVEAGRAEHRAQPLPQHCWLQPGGPDAARVPALLLRWEQRADGWWGQVFTARPDGEAVIMVERWFPADDLRPLR